MRWLNLAVKGDKRCPMCKAKARYSDIRYLYARRLLAVDTTEVEAIRRELQCANSEKNRIQVELTKAKCKQQVFSAQIKELKERVEYLQRKL